MQSALLKAEAESFFSTAFRHAQLDLGHPSKPVGIQARGPRSGFSSARGKEALLQCELCLPYRLPMPFVWQGPGRPSPGQKGPYAVTVRVMIKSYAAFFIKKEKKKKEKVCVLKSKPQHFSL